MSFASNMQDTANRLLKYYGQPMTVTREDEGAFIPATGTTDTASSTSFTGYGYPYPYEKREIDNVVILTTDIQVYIRTAQEIKIGDLIIFDSTDHRVMNSENIGAQGQNIVYRCQLRC